jgi:phosphatidyl-myo-inositol dimannoside synthase
LNSRNSPQVMLLTPMFNGRDGISLVSRVAAAALVASGFRVNVYSLCKEPYIEVPAGIRLWTAENSSYKFVAKVVSGALRPVPPNARMLAMHVHLAGTALPLVWRGAKLSIFLHGIEVWKRLRMRERMALRAASTVLANSDCTVQRFGEINRDFRDLSIDLCPLGIAPLNGPVVGPCLTPGRFALIVGRLVGESRYKGHDELLELWPAVLDQYPDFSLVIAGDGPDRPRLQEKVSDLGLQDVVRFTGLVNDEELQKLYRDCEFFVMPSMGEGFGLVYLEAMRARKACIGAPGAAASVIEDGRTGIIADPRCKDEMLGAILALISKPQRTIQMGNAGYERFLNNFTADHFGKKLLGALHWDHLEVAKCAE